MDPLTIAAAIVGILTAAQQVSSCVGNLISKAKKAPDEFVELKSTVDTIHAFLSQLQALLLGQADPKQRRLGLILVDQIVVALSACVKIFSSLDLLVRSFENDKTTLDVFDRLHWATKSGEIKDHLHKLEMQKSSLTLMLTILTW